MQCEGLVTRVNVCEYEQNPSRDEEVMDKIQNCAQKIEVFTVIYVQGQGHMKVKVRSLWCNVKVLSQGLLCVSMNKIYQGIQKL